MTEYFAIASNLICVRPHPKRSEVRKPRDGLKPQVQIEKKRVAPGDLQACQGGQEQRGVQGLTTD